MISYEGGGWGWAITSTCHLGDLVPPMITTSHNLPGISYPLWARTYPPCSSYPPRPPLACPYSSQTAPHLSHTRNPVHPDRSPVGPELLYACISYESIDDRMTQCSVRSVPVGGFPSHFLLRQLCVPDTLAQHTESSGILPPTLP